MRKKGRWREVADKNAAERKAKSRQSTRKGLTDAVTKGIAGEKGPELAQWESKLPISSEETKEAEKQRQATARTEFRADAQRGSKARQNRMRALEICECFRLIAQNNNDSLPTTDLEPLAVALREGHFDLLELAMSARRCQILPLLLQKPNATTKERANALDEIGSSKHGFEAMQWAAFLFVNGWFPWVSAEAAKNWTKQDIIEFLKLYFPKEICSAIPTTGNKEKSAKFWQGIGEDLPQSRGYRPKEVENVLRDVKSLRFLERQT